ncbi:MAG: PqqD family protein [Bdellovibrionales bacterium]|nr:PqqD family protein [Bdellovibrionales bacterium]
METYHPTPSIAWNVIGDQVVALSLGEERRVHEFSEVASVIWQHLNSGPGFAELHRKVIEEFDVDSEEARRDLRDLLEDLRAKGLVEVRP